MNSNTWIHQCWPSSKHLHSSMPYRHWVLSRGLVKSNGQYGWIVRKRKLKESVLLACLDDDDDKTWVTNKLYITIFFILLMNDNDR